MEKWSVHVETILDLFYINNASKQVSLVFRDYKLMNIPNYNKQNYPFCSFDLQFYNLHGSSIKLQKTYII